MKIFLVGYMASGKSTLGRKLAGRMNMGFLDTDEWITQRSGKSIRLIFEEHGESAFREWEAQALQAISTMDDIVVATGGGLPCFNHAMDQLNSTGITLYLKAAPDLLVERIVAEKENRPLVLGIANEKLSEWVAAQLAERSAFYEKAKLTVPAESISVEELVMLIQSR